MDYYEVLGISRSADTQEIRKAYKRLALSHHPDKVAEELRPAAEQRFKSISEAYEVLSDEHSRRQYDLGGAFDMNGMYEQWDDPGFGPEAFAEFFGFTAGPANGANGHANGHFGGTNGHANGSFGANGHGSNGYFGFGARTDDADVEVDLSLEDIFRGRVLKMSSLRQVICRGCAGAGGRPRSKPKACGVCGGTGSVRKLRALAAGLMTADHVPCDACRGRGHIFRDKDRCKRCKGAGTTEEKSILEIYVPPGAPDGHRVILEGKADMTPGKTTGDIVVTVRVAEHTTFTRAGDDLVARATLSLEESLLGFSKVLVTHLDGRDLRVNVPRGTITSPGTPLKLPGQGMPRLGSTGHGDLYVEIDVDFPTHISPALAAALETPHAEPAFDAFDVDAYAVPRKDLPYDL